MIAGKVLDTSAVLDIASGDSVYGQALLAVSNRLGMVLAVPTITLTSAWAHATTDTERMWLALLGDAEPSVVTVHLDQAAASDIGSLAAAAGLPEAPLGTAHAARVALDREWPVVTRDPDGLLILSADVRTETIP